MRNAGWHMDKGGSSGSRVLCVWWKWTGNEKGKSGPAAYTLFYGTLWDKQTVSIRQAEQNSGKKFLRLLQQIWIDAIPPHQNPPPPQSHTSRSTCIPNDDEETWLECH